MYNLILYLFLKLEKVNTHLLLTYMFSLVYIKKISFYTCFTNLLF